LSLECVHKHERYTLDKDKVQNVVKEKLILFALLHSLQAIRILIANFRY